MTTVSLDTLRFTKTHEWIRLEGSIGYVGITDHAQHEVTDVVYVELPPLGKTVKKGEECLTIESVKAAFSIYAAVAGKVVQVNSRLLKEPGLINQSPYEDGWMVKLEVENPAELADLMTHEQYQTFTQTGK
ncbi:MAG: glycine cleavage system protein GcvH [Elusimicrobia bacterium]|nr:glycine cleavage system protein GcvH [Elusimicrobiota bacterium]